MIVFAAVSPAVQSPAKERPAFSLRFFFLILSN